MIPIIFSMFELLPVILIVALVHIDVRLFKSFPRERRMKIKWYYRYLPGSGYYLFIRSLM